MILNAESIGERQHTRWLQTRANNGKHRANSHISVIECLPERAHTRLCTHLPPHHWANMCSLAPNTPSRQIERERGKSAMKIRFQRLPIENEKSERNKTHRVHCDCLLETTASRASQCARHSRRVFLWRISFESNGDCRCRCGRTVSNHLKCEMNDWIVNELMCVGDSASEPYGSKRHSMRVRANQWCEYTRRVHGSYVGT